MRATRKDIPHINYILSQDDVYQYCIDDNYPQEARWRMGTLLMENTSAKVYLPNPHCVFIGVPTDNSVVYEVHVAVEPCGRGRDAVRAAKETIKEFFEDVPTAHKLIGFTPTTLKRAIMFSRLVGFNKEGICRDSFLKDGVLHDQYISGLSREEVLRWQQE